MSKQYGTRYYNKNFAENRLQNDNTQNARKAIGTAGQYVYKRRPLNPLPERAGQNKNPHKKASEIDKIEREQEKPKNNKAYNIGTNQNNLRQSNNM